MDVQATFTPPRRGSWVDVTVRAAQQALSVALLDHPQLQGMTEEMREELIDVSYSTFCEEVRSRRELMAETMGVSSRVAQTYFDGDFPKVLAEQATQEVLTAAGHAADLANTFIQMPLADLFSSLAALSHAATVLVAVGDTEAAETITSFLGATNAALACSMGHAFAEDNLALEDTGDAVIPLVGLPAPTVFFTQALLMNAHNELEAVECDDEFEDFFEELKERIESLAEHLSMILNEAGASDEN